MNFINYNALISSIPKEWNKIIKNNIQIDPHSAANKIKSEIREKSKNKSSTRSTTQILYQILIKGKLTDNNKNKIKWEADLDYEIKDAVWEKIFTYTKTLTNCTKLLFMQYRINHRALVTNVLRHKWDNTITKLCTFCGMEDETIVHIFTRCKKVIDIWKLLSRWLKHFCFIDFETEEYAIVFNRYRDSFPKLVNTILLIVKQYIYAAKCQKRELKFTEIIGKIQEYKMLEKVNAIKNQKLEEHNAKWSIYNI